MSSIKLAGIVDTSTLDFIGRVSAVIYLCGCPYRCPWCQNPDLVIEGEMCHDMEISALVKELQDDFLINAVVVTGGEPLMQAETIDMLAGIKKETGLPLKIDTNGFFPAALEKALPFLDFVAMDIKSPLDSRYGIAIGRLELSDSAVVNVKKSLSILKNWPKLREARTTVIPGLTDKKEDIESIAREVLDAGFNYYTLQQFIPRTTLDRAYEKKKSPTHSLMLELGKAAKAILPKASVRITTQLKGLEEIKLDA